MAKIQFLSKENGWSQWKASSPTKIPQPASAPGKVFIHKNNKVHNNADAEISMHWASTDYEKFEVEVEVNGETERKVTDEDKLVRKTEEGKTYVVRVRALKCCKKSEWT